jgi:hypothetical protein
MMRFALIAFVCGALACAGTAGVSIAAFDGDARGWGMAVAEISRDRPGLRIPVSHKIERDLSSITTIRIIAVSSGVEIAGGEADRLEASYTGRIVWRGSGRPDAALINILETVAGETLTLQVEPDGRDEDCTSDTALRVVLPRGFSGRVDAKTVSGDLVVSRVSGASAAALETISGDVDVRDRPSTRLDVGTISGDVSLKGSAACAAARVKTISGDVEVELPGMGAVDADLSTASGDIESAVPLKLDESGRSAHAVGAAGSSRLEILTTSGDIRLAASPLRSR